MPLFGQLYWLTGNILIDRANRSKAVGTIDQVVTSLKESDVSVWMFLRALVLVAVVCCHSKQVHSMLRLVLAYLSSLSCVAQQVA